MGNIVLAVAAVVLMAAGNGIAFDPTIDFQVRAPGGTLQTGAETLQPGDSPEVPASRTSHGDRRADHAASGAYSYSTVAAFCLIAAILFLIGVWARQRRLQSELDRFKESGERYRLMIHSMEEGIVLIDADGTVRWVNPAVQRLFGYSQGELLGCSINVLMPRDYLEEHDNDLHNFLESTGHHGIGVLREAKGLRRDGTEFFMQLFVSEFSLGGQRLYTAVFEDISERKKVEALVAESGARAEQAAAYKSQFLANMSHEIRTPMNGVLGMLELLSACHLEPAEREYVHIARQSAVSLLALIDDILDLSKIEAGRVELENVLVDLHVLIEDAAAIGASLALPKDLRLNCYIAPEVPALAPTDPARLRQVLLNLLSNAVKFTDKGEVNLRAELEDTLEDGVIVRFSVEDTGIGIAPENLVHLFNPFIQADSSITRRFGGTGLGLTISRHLVELMGGEIQAQSKPSVGSVFTFTARLGSPIGGEADHVDSRLKSLRALVVDNNDTARRYLQKYLLDLGVGEVDTAEGAEQARRIVHGAVDEERCHHLVVIKYPLRGAAGFVSALDPIRKQNRIRLVALNPVNAPRTSSRRLNLDDALIRPVRRADLEHLLGYFLLESGDGTDEAQKAVETGGSKYGQTRRVLLAEDNPINQAVCVKMLESLGVDLEVVENGQEAVERLQAEHFDLILMDCQMPVMDGFAATRKIRSLERKRNRGKTPIVAVTARAMKGDRERCLAAGMDAYISKPYRLTELRELIQRNWLGDAARSGSQTRHL